MKMKEMIGKGSVIDVRTRPEFEAEHFPGAYNIPLDELSNRMDELKQLPAPIVMNCRSGARSSMATTMLQQAGIAEVYNAGGLDDILQQAQ